MSLVLGSPTGSVKIVISLIFIVEHTLKPTLKYDQRLNKDVRPAKCEHGITS